MLIDLGFIEGLVLVLGLVVAHWDSGDYLG